jgi:hypothetical protein
MLLRHYLSQGASKRKSTETREPRATYCQQYMVDPS